MSKNKKTLGIIGGMGPAATADLYTKIIAHTPAKCDQDHLHVIIDSDAETPDRTGFILSLAGNENSADSTSEEKICAASSQLGSAAITQASASASPHTYNAASPLPHLTQSAQRLQAAGADFVVMACITAHIFATEIANSIDVPFFAIPDIATNALQQKRADKVVILSTIGTAQAGIFDKPLSVQNIEFKYAAKEHGDLMMELIYSLVKGGNPNLADHLKTEAKAMLSKYRQNGYYHFLLACTELPIAFKMLDLIDDTFTDCTEELAKFCVEYALRG